MNRLRRMLLFLPAVAIAHPVSLRTAAAQSAGMAPQEVLQKWYGLSLELVRHTATYSPPVASRSFAYLGVTAFEAVASGSDRLQSLAGQVNALKSVPGRQAGQTYDNAVILQAAMSFAVRTLFENTGPTGQRAMRKMGDRLAPRVAAGIAPDIVARSEEYGREVARHVLGWSQDDGGAVVENMGFPLEYKLGEGPEHWAPTNLIPLQQKPLLPFWGRNRTFAMPDGAACPLPPPPAYSEEKDSQFYREALEVYETRNKLTEEQAAIARFWSDDPMLSQTPPGHWISIALYILQRDNIELETAVDVLARLGIVLADAFIACWRQKYVYDLVRPVTFIRRRIDPKWDTLLITPPFPEYPSGHSVQSGAAATVLTSLFGENFAFEDASREIDGLPARSFSSFWHAANEAGISRLYGGVHYRSAVESGLEQGRCIGAYTNALRTWS